MLSRKIDPVRGTDGNYRWEVIEEACRKNHYHLVRLDTFITAMVHQNRHPQTSTYDSLLCFLEQISINPTFPYRVVIGVQKEHYVTMLFMQEHSWLVNSMLTKPMKLLPETASQFIWHSVSKTGVQGFGAFMVIPEGDVRGTDTLSNRSESMVSHDQVHYDCRCIQQTSTLSIMILLSSCFRGKWLL